MSDLSMNGAAKRRVHLWSLLRDSIGTHLHLFGLLVQAWMRSGDRTIEAALNDGTHVSLAHGFELDGTTLVVTNHDATTRRIPASRIVRICDKGDYGYV